MIRPIDIRLNAAHPDYPLAEAVTFTGSPSTVLIRGVPPNCGRWAITAVSVAATFPDGSTTTRAAVQSANGVWVATLPATATSGRTANGLRILADGIDENGEAVTGYVLGVADFAVASLDVTPAPQPGETSWQMLYFDAVPSVLRKGDVTKIDGVLKFYDGEAWEAFAGDIPAPSTATPAMDGTGAAGSSAAYARGDHVHPSDTSKQNALSMQQLANIASVPNKLDASNGVATGLVTYLGTFNGFEYGLRFGTYGSDYAVQIVARSAGQQASWQATANLMVQKSKTGYAALLSDIPSVPSASTDTPNPDGTGSAGSATTFSRGDHRHPTDTTRVAKSGDTMSGNLVIQAADAFLKIVNSGESQNPYIQISKDEIRLGYDGGYMRIYLPTQGGRLALVEQLNDKLNSSSAAPAFQVYNTYAVGDHVTYNGALYRCTTAVTTAGAWTGSTNWTAEDMTTPDATLDVTATDKLLRLVATNGDVIWGQGYNLSTESSATVLTEQVRAFTFAADAVADQAIVLPSVAASKVGDFILDVTNLSANDRSLTLTGLDSAFSVVVKAGDDLSETLTVAAGEMARYYFTMTAFRVNSLPTWQVAKEAVENGGVQS